ncbi:DUF4097 family beta strand repeat-containing protein [Streptomyces xiamenensis]|uniref:DUF4097 family beta strand repeat-containing protein n=1 Tax=Streptomyces xiamenensis TaxID=408015 RepID=UPI0036A3B444
MRRALLPVTVLAAGTAVLLAGLTGCSQQTHDGAAEHAAFGVEGGTLTVEAGGSDVLLVPDPGLSGEIGVTRWFTASKVSGTTDADWQMDGDTLTLRVTCDGFVTTCDIRHEITVPADLAVTLRGSNGAIEAAGFSAPLDLESDNGSVTVRDIGAPSLRLASHNGKVSGSGLDVPLITADTHNGGVTLALTTVPEEVAVTSHNGGVDLTVPAAGTYRVDTDTHNGFVDVDAPHSADAAARIGISTHNGAISVHGSD